MRFGLMIPSTAKHVSITNRHCSVIKPSMEREARRLCVCVCAYAGCVCAYAGYCVTQSRCRCGAGLAIRVWGSRRMVIATGTNVQRGLQVLILFIYLPLWIIVSVNQRRLDKGFHAAENSYTATLEGDRQRRLYLSPAVISIVWCKLILSPRTAVTEEEQGVKSSAPK